MLPPNPGGVYVETKSIPWFRLEKSLMKNRKKASVPAEAIPSEISSVRSSSVSVNVCDRARRLERSTRK